MIDHNNYKILNSLCSILFIVSFVSVRIIYTPYVLLSKLYMNFNNEHFWNILPTHHWNQTERIYTIDFYAMDFLLLLPMLFLHMYWMRLIIFKIKKMIFFILNIYNKC